MPDDRFLLLHMHELLAYLGHVGICSILTVAQHGMNTIAEYKGFDVSYLADTVILFRYFELTGEVRKAISVFKKRSGRHERTIRELRLRSGGIEIGPPLKEFRGVLTGTPEYERNLPPIAEP
jgi:circadian clock protein KaiC